MQLAAYYPKHATEPRKSRELNATAPQIPHPYQKVIGAGKVEGELSRYGAQWIILPSVRFSFGKESSGTVTVGAAEGYRTGVQTPAPLHLKGPIH